MYWSLMNLNDDIYVDKFGLLDLSPVSSQSQAWDEVKIWERTLEKKRGKFLGHLEPYHWGNPRC